jgi:hypothetical protein
MRIVEEMRQRWNKKNRALPFEARLTGYTGRKLFLLFPGDNEVLFLKNFASLYRPILFLTPQRQTADITTNPNSSLSQTVESRSSKARKSFFIFSSPCPENTDTP